MNKSWQNTLVSPDATIIKALEIIDKGALQIALVVDGDGKMLGTVTDGDVRNGILRGISLEEPVRKIMCRAPVTAKADEDREAILEKMRRADILHIPLLDGKGRVIGLEILKNLALAARRDNVIVIMAGGLGKRLRPLTDDCPKPMLSVAGKPVLEIIIGAAMEYGFHRFYISVNYKSEMIEDYFGDGSRWRAEITYLQEKEELGTAGALSCLPERPAKPFIVMNGDLLTKVNFHHLLNFHGDHNAAATMCVREYHYQVPYGVVRADGHRLAAIDEKPVQTFFVNAGIYVMEPGILDLIDPRTSLDMPVLFEKLIQQRKEAIVFPIREYWLDIGHPKDLERAQYEYQNNFRK